MRHHIEKLANEPIVIVTPSSTLQSEEELKADMASDMAFLAKLTEPVFFVIDLTNSPLEHSLNDVAIASNIAARQLNMFQHPNIRKAIFVTTNKMLRLAVEGLDSEVYGFVKVKVVETVDDALSYAHDNG
jgi:hypothetical protein